ncbi:MAG: hypothetical protein JWM78_2366 [Verrucomicrobiaceae bacterium]|nr:hypothetical protein [Verrucomicrobiaceae bacterium]
MPELSAIEDILRDQPRKPPLDKWHPELSGDIDIRIDGRGDWYHEGTRIQRQPLVNLFASILRREGDGDYYLVTPVEKWRIAVEDTPLLAVDMEIVREANTAQRLIFRLNTGELIEVSAEHPLKVAVGGGIDARPYIQLDNGLSAKLTTAAFYRLADILETRNDLPGVSSNGEWFSLGAA